MKLNLFTGNAIGAGKSHTVIKRAWKLKDEGKPFLIISLADPFKTFLKDIMHMTKEKDEFEGSDVHLSKYFIKEELKKLLRSDKVPNFDLFMQYYESDLPYHIRYRKVIQTLGTEVGRALNKNIWADRLVQRLKEFPDYLEVFIDDWRFLNEYLYLREYYFVDTYAVVNENVTNPEIYKHESESNFKTLLQYVKKENIIEVKF